MKKKTYLTTSVAPLLAALMVVTSCGGAADKKFVKINDGLKYYELKPATGDLEARKGSDVTVHYTGYLNKGNDELGQKFDSSRDHGTPFKFRVGAGQVIKGWDLGVATMHVGQKIRLFIDPEYGYGSRGAGRLIPPNAKLIFDIELLEVN